MTHALLLLVFVGVLRGFGALFGWVVKPFKISSSTPFGFKFTVLDAYLLVGELVLCFFILLGALGERQLAGIVTALLTLPIGLLWFTCICILGNFGLRHRLRRMALISSLTVSILGCFGLAIVALADTAGAVAEGTVAPPIVHAAVAIAIVYGVLVNRVLGGLPE